MQQSSVPPPPAPIFTATGIRTQFEYFGTWSELFVVTLVHGLLCLITFNIYWPWAYCAIRKWQLEHTYCEGRRMTFVGNGGELFVLMLVHFLLLTLITCGIYAFLMIPTQKLLEFDTRNTRIEG